MGSDEYTGGNLIESKIGGLRLQMNYKAGNKVAAILLSGLVFALLVSETLKRQKLASVATCGD